jgi:hypothetical protein
MLSIGTILKSETENVGTIFYRVTSIKRNSHMIKPLCKIRKGFQTTKNEDTDEFEILKSEVGFNYLEATKREIAKIKGINMETV